MKKLLQDLITNTPGLLAIMVTDKDGVPIAKALSKDHTDMNKRNTYTGPFSSACDQASKLGLGKNNKIVCFYEKYQIVSMNKDCIHYHFIGIPNSNTGDFLTLDTELDHLLGDLTELYNSSRNLQD